MINDQASLAARKAFYRRINKALESHKRENAPQGAAAKIIPPFSPSAIKAAGIRRWQQSRQQPPSDWRD